MVLQKNSNLSQLLTRQKFYQTWSCCRLRATSDSPLPTRCGTLFPLNPSKRIVRGCVLVTHPKHIVWNFILHYRLLFRMPPNLPKIDHLHRYYHFYSILNMWHSLCSQHFQHFHDVKAVLWSAILLIRVVASPSS